VTLEQRLRVLAESLPSSGAVVFTKTDLEELIEPTAPSVQPASDQPDPTVAQVAERYGKNPQTVRDWINSGKLKAYKLRGREWRIRPEDLERQRRGDSEAQTTSASPPLGAWRDQRTRA
jgi:excisionase family DNA binding protein